MAEYDKVIEYWLNELCNNKESIGGNKKKSKKKILIGGHSKIIAQILGALGLDPSCKYRIHPSPLKVAEEAPEVEPDTVLIDMPKELLLLILKMSMDENEDNKTLNTLSLVNKEYNLTIKNLVNPVDKGDKIDLEKWIRTDQIIKIYSNFIEHVIKTAGKLIVTERNSNFTILFTEELKYNDKTYDIVYKKIKFYRGEFLDIMYINIELCNNSIIEYKEQNSEKFIILNDQGIKSKILGNFQKYPLFVKTRSIDLLIKNKDIFARVYSFLYTKQFYVTNGYLRFQDINKIINNDYYIDLPTKFKGLGLASFIYLPRIYKELIINKNAIINAIYKEHKLNEIFDTYNDIIPESVPEPVEAVEAAKNYDYTPLVDDLYFTMDEINQINDYVKETKDYNFLQRSLQTINDAKLADTEKQYTNVTMDLKIARKKDIMDKLSNYAPKSLG